MDVWFCAPQEPWPRGTRALVCIAAMFAKAALLSTSRGHLRLPLTNTYHGCPLYPH